jgi:hypothetical protein
MPLVLNGATSGSTTIQATDAVTATLTLPSSTGTLVSTANPISGSVIQTVNYYTVGAGASSSAGTTPTSTGYSVTITPKFSTSKILVTANSSGGGAASGSIYFTLYRGGTNLATGTSPSAFCAIRNNASGSAPFSPVSMTVLDSPATTSATTYTVYFFSNAGNTAYFGWPQSDLNSCVVNIVAQEIAA